MKTVFFNIKEGSKLAHNQFIEKMSKRLKELRTDAGLSQNDVAKILNVSRIDYNRYENRTRNFPLELLCNLADFYKISIDYLIGRED